MPSESRYTFVLMDGEEVIIDNDTKCDFDRIAFHDGSLWWIDDGGCEILVESVYGCETDTPVEPPQWYDEFCRPHETNHAN